MDAAIVIGFMMMSLMAVMAMHMTLIEDIVPSLHEKMNYVPTFYFYNNGTMITEIEGPDEKESKAFDRRHATDKNPDDDINKIRLDIIDLGQKKIEAITINDIELAIEIGKEIEELEQKLLELGYDPADPLINLKLYDMFAVPAKLFFVGLLIFSLVVLLLERVNLGVQRGTAMKIFKCSIISLAVIYAVPEVWDPIALELNDIGLYMLDPVDGKPNETVTRLWCRMGNICVVDSRDLLDEDLHKSLMANPNMGRDFFADIILGLMRVTMESMMAMTFFISATIRIAFMLMVLITFPLWLILRLIPPMKKVTNAVLSSFVGCCFAPPLMSIILFIGEQNLISRPGDALTEWVTVLGIAILSQTFLTMLAPILQSSMSQATSTVSTGIQSTTMAISSGVGIVKGMASKAAHKWESGRDGGRDGGGPGPGPDPRHSKNGGAGIA